LAIATFFGVAVIEMLDLKRAGNKTLHTVVRILPIVLGMLLLTGIVIKALPQDLLAAAFGSNGLIDVLLGASLGSVAAGHPLLSYILGGELLASGATLYAVTALIAAWVTVGLVQLPAEVLLLGRRFAFFRNASSFVLALAVAVATVGTLQLLGVF
jgi:hypothetical protein